MSQQNPYDLDKLSQFFGITDQDKKEQAFVKKKDSVFYLFLNKKANAFDPDLVRLINKLMDQIEENEGPTALVFTSFNQKFFSPGLNLQFMASKQEPDVYNFILEFIRLLGRIQAFSVPCIAMVNGYAVAGGCMFAFASDYRVMRNDFGYFELNEVKLGMPLPPGMLQTVMHKTGYNNEFRDLILQSRQFKAKELEQLKWIDQSVNPQDLYKETHKLATKVSEFGDNKVNFKKLKEEMNKNSIDCCFNKQHAVGVRGETKLSLPKM